MQQVGCKLILLAIIYSFQTEVQVTATPNISFVDYQTSMVQISKRIAQLAHEMVGKASSPETAAELGHMANLLTKQFSELAIKQQGACAASPSPEVSGIMNYFTLIYFNEMKLKKSLLVVRCC